MLEPGELVIQTCGEPLCVNPEHLDVGTQADLDRWSPENVARRFWGRVSQPADGCWEWQGRRQTRYPYGQTTYRGRAIPAHRLAWIITHGDIDAGLVVCHRCDNPPCCRPDHLLLGTYAENSADMVTKGRQARRRGTQASGAKMTAELVRELRARYDAGGVSTHQLAAEYGLSSMPVWRAVTRRSYVDVD